MLSIFFEAGKSHNHDFDILKDKKVRKQEFDLWQPKKTQKYEFHFLQQAAGGPTGWGQRWPVGPRGLLSNMLI